MSFIDGIFFLFVGFFVLFYFLLPMRCRWLILLLASLAFTATWGIEKIPFVLGGVLVAWWAARAMEREYLSMDQILKEPSQMDRMEKRALQAAVKKKCRHILWIAVALLLGFLVYTKAARYIIGIPMIASQLGSKSFSVIVPLGISYYTLSLVGYLADVYWRKDQAEPNFFKLLLFAVYFPKIVQGPISSHKKLAPQLEKGHPFDYNRFCHGLQLMVWGYFKKLVIADRLNLFVTEVFGSYEKYEGSVLLVAAIFGAFQLYCDFSGCMDIAGGLSQVLGIELEKNFDHPFFSRTAAEFWRRWHITLGTWFKDYVYMPLVISQPVMKLSVRIRKRFGKRAGKLTAQVIPLAVVWLLTGLWHGTGANYIVWGIFWGTIIILSTALEPEWKRLPVLLHLDTKSKGYTLFQQWRTFALFVITRIIVLPGNLAVSGEIFQKMITGFGLWALVDGSLYQAGLNRPNFILAVLCIVLLGWVGKSQQQGSIRERISRMPLPVRWTIYYAAFFSVVIFGIYGAGYDASTFVYMQY